MDSNHSISLAASQPCCHNFQVALPTFESITNSQSGAVSPQSNVDTLSPPPYSTLDTGTHVDDWVLHYSRLFWTRTVKRRGKTSYQYSIEADDTIGWTGDGRVFFTCGMMPRDGYGEDNVTTNCEHVILALKLHRIQCLDCDIRYIPTYRRTCVLDSHSLLLKHHMVQHDTICSCRCFDIHAPPRRVSHNPAASGSTSETPQPHPQAERQALNKELDIQENTLEQKWEYARRKYDEGFYWTRTVNNGDGIWHQCGISERPNDDGPEFFFTCKMKTRRKGDEQKIREVCKDVAAHMRAHRSRGSADYHRCTCNFKTWRKGKGLGGCHESCYRLTTKMIRQCVGFSMAYHDKLCSCGCFDVQTGEESNVSGQWLRD